MFFSVMRGIVRWEIDTDTHVLNACFEKVFKSVIGMCVSMSGYPVAVSVFLWCVSN